MPKYDDFDLDVKVDIAKTNKGECLATSHVYNSLDGYCFPPTSRITGSPQGNICAC